MDNTKEQFPVGMKYLLDDDLYTVVNAFIDSSTEYRTVTSIDGELVFTLASLLKDSRNPNFIVVSQ
jgi:hypothetical protein